MPVAGVIQVDSFTRETGVCVSVVDDVLLQSVVLTGWHVTTLRINLRVQCGQSC